jgi:hypothetical protein
MSKKHVCTGCEEPGADIVRTLGSPLGRFCVELAATPENRSHGLLWAAWRPLE